MPHPFVYSSIIMAGRTMRNLLSHRCISSQTARALLGIAPSTASSSAELTLMDIRLAYFKKAKECHPDMQSKDENNQVMESSHQDFLQITMAYEILQNELAGYGEDKYNSIVIPYDEEQAFRVACEQQLGLPAEIVEECKENTMFREWLTGNTDSAHTWRNFFMQHGGLAPKLKASAGVIEAGAVSTLVPRRRKR